MTVWAILDSYGYTPVEVARETKLSIFYVSWNYSHTQSCERRSQSALDWRGTEVEARRLSAQLNAARDEYHQQATAARQWYRDRITELTAQGIEAAKAGETEGLDGNRESPVGNADAPEPSTPSPTTAGDES